MIQTTNTIECYEDDWARLGKSPALAARRALAFEHFRALGFPTTRDEDWRFTSVTPISGKAFRLAPAGVGDVDDEALERLRVDPEGTRLVFVNGRLDQGRSSPGRLPRGVQVGSLRSALAGDAALLEAHLARHAGTGTDAFAALNTAFLDDGAVISVPRGTIVETPIEIVWVSAPHSGGGGGGGAVPTVSHPRTLLVAGEACQVALVETFLGPAGAAYFTNAVSEIVAEPSAIVDHAKVVREGDGGLHVGATRIDLGRDTSVRSCTWTMGGALVRNNVTAVFAGPGANATLDGLAVETGDELVDNHLRVEHAAPHCDSREFFKVILDGKSRAVFTGRILVVQDAQKTDAKQTNKNLLLSDEAMVDTRPQLEIFADDVKCTHGATIGQLDDEAVFYLRSRGMAAEAARGLLTYAFAAEMLDRVRPAGLRPQLRESILERLPQAAALGAM